MKANTPPININRAAECLAYLADPTSLTVIQQIQEQGFIARASTSLTPFQKDSLHRLQSQGIILFDEGKDYYIIHPMISREALIVIDSLFPPTFMAESENHE